MALEALQAQGRARLELRPGQPTAGGAWKHSDDASLVCCGCMERGKARCDTDCPLGAVKREITKQQEL